MASDDEFEFEFDEMPLLLTAPGADYAGPVVLRSVAAFATKAVEPAGSAYHARWCAKFAKPLKVKKARVEQSYAELEAEDAGMCCVMLLITPRRCAHRTRHPCVSAAERRRMAKVMDMSNHYEVLDLAKENIHATDDQIYRAHRKLMLVFHPDKKAGAGSGAGDAAPDPIYLAIQKAFDVLSDVDKRRRFDSTFAFDENIPAEKAPAGEDFFAAFRPVFERNARFSSVTPVPGLGGPETPIDEVKARRGGWGEGGARAGGASTLTVRAFARRPSTTSGSSLTRGATSRRTASTTLTRPRSARRSAGCSARTSARRPRPSASRCSASGT